MKHFDLRRVLATTLLPLACGCAPAPAPPGDSCRLDEQTLAEALAERSAGKSFSPIQVLVLSGGGAYGAWGAGVLRGWRDRPRFDVVTAISTGALQASAAFLAEPVDDANLEEAYTNVDSAGIYGPRFWLLLPLLNSVYSTAPLARQIERVVSDDVIDRVGRQATLGRKLYVGTTNLDRSTLTIWDMTCLASSGRADRYARYRKILLAATAIPVLFPPVRIDGELHADGGTRADLFLNRSLLPIVHAAKSASVRKPTVYILLNGQAPGRTAPTRNFLIPIALRAIGNLLSAAQQADISSIVAMARREQLDARLCVMPSELDGPSSAMDFERSAMRRLFQAGATWGAGNAWIDLVGETSKTSTEATAIGGAR